MDSRYYVYILGNERGVLYVGVTNDLERRLQEHKDGKISSFTRKYKVYRLLYFEIFDYIGDAIEFEKRIMGWARKKKLDLIRGMNPKFEDLAESRTCRRPWLRMDSSLRSE
jgi:putative endonuclease